MPSFARLLCFLFLMIIPFQTFANDKINIPILCYHNFNPVKPGMMNLKPAVIEAQIKWLKANGFTIIPLQEAVEYLQGQRASLPAKPVVITIDDGWESAYTYMLPLARKYNLPMTLFIYPQPISHGKNNLTWEQLKEMQQTGLFDIQSHTFSHPNFKQEKKHLSQSSFKKLVNEELINSKKILEDKLGKKITLLAWPFGIYDDYLKQEAAKAGYLMSFSIDARDANRTFNPMAQPRYMILEGQSMKHFEMIVK